MIKVIWQPHGPITLCNKGWPQFEALPGVPGLYKITLNDGRLYIGETQNLKKRLGEYRRPTKGVEQEHILYHAIIEAKGGKLQIFTDERLSSKAVRGKLEQAEIAAALAAGHDLINNDGPTTPAKLRARIKFLEFELAATRRKLSELEKTSL
jgi:hypothetical protein